MVTYVGGQIKQDCRGDLALVITPGEVPRTYGAFLYTQEDPEFIVLTGVRAVEFPPVRIYAGVNKKVAEQIIDEVHHKRADDLNLREIDARVINSPFIER